MERRAQAREPSSNIIAALIVEQDPGCQIRQVEQKAPPILPCALRYRHAFHQRHGVPAVQFGSNVQKPRHRDCLTIAIALVRLAHGRVNIISAQLPCRSSLLEAEKRGEYRYSLGRQQVSMTSSGRSLMVLRTEIGLAKPRKPMFSFFQSRTIFW